MIGTTFQWSDDVIQRGPQNVTKSSRTWSDNDIQMLNAILVITVTEYVRAPVHGHQLKHYEISYKNAFSSGISASSIDSEYGCFIGSLYSTCS